MAALLAASLPPVPGGAEPPQRVVSTNLCADQLVLELLPRSRIAAVSSLAANPALSAAAGKAQGIPVVTSSAEAVIGQRPDLVVAGRFHEGRMAALVARYGISVYFVASPDTLAETATMIRDLAARLDASEAGAAMIARLNAGFVAARKEGEGLRRALIWRPNGYTSGSQSLHGALMTAVGLHNLADELGVIRGGLVSLEAVLAARPDLLIIDDPSPIATSRAQALVFHPALFALSAERRQVPMAAWICAGPGLSQSARALASPYGTGDIPSRGN